MILADRIVRLHGALRGAQLPHAFGGALALAWCTRQARGTVDIDVNVFVAAASAAALLAALPAELGADGAAASALARNGQVRLAWGGTPVDIFLNTTRIHEEAARCVCYEWFAGERLPFLSCFHVAVFKAFFNRTKDWADIEAMRDAGTLDVHRVKDTVARYLGEDDERIASLAGLEA